MSKTEHISFEIIPEKFDDFLTMVKDLTRIHDTVKLVIGADATFAYTILGTNQIVLAMKSHTFPTADYFKFDRQLDTTIEIVILSCKKFVRSLAFFQTTARISGKFTYKVFDEGIGEVRTMILSNRRMKLQSETGDRGEIKSITEAQLVKILNPSRRDWSFTIKDEDLEDIRKLAKINSDENRRILEIAVKDGEVNVSEPGIWEFGVDTISGVPDCRVLLNKNHLPFIDKTGSDAVFHVYPTSILTEWDNSKLMLSFEQDFA